MPDRVPVPRFAMLPLTLLLLLGRLRDLLPLSLSRWAINLSLISALGSAIGRERDSAALSLSLVVLLRVSRMLSRYCNLLLLLLLPQPRCVAPLLSG
jgi:hypothetical protein